MPGDEARTRAILRASALALLTVTAACGGGEGDAPRVPIGEPAERRAWSEGVAARVDSGNASFRQGEYEAARRHYAEAAEVDPEVAAAWFGLYMAESALGNEAAAESALVRAGEMASAARAHHLLPADSGDSPRDSDMPRPHPGVSPVDSGGP